MDLVAFPDGNQDKLGQWRFVEYYIKQGNPPLICMIYVMKGTLKFTGPDRRVVNYSADYYAGPAFAGGAAQEDLKGIGVNGEPSILDTVIKDPLGIGYGNLNSIFDLSGGGLVPGIIIPPLDINANGQADAEEVYKVKDDAFGAVANGTYPSPPARFENLATKGKPTGVTLAFIKWILTDGQQFLEAAGYVPLTPEQQAESLAKLQ